jgi:hypothetical protein
MWRGARRTRPTTRSTMHAERGLQAGVSTAGSLALRPVKTAVAAGTQLQGSNERYKNGE